MSKLSKYDTWHTNYYEGATFTGGFEMYVNETVKRLHPANIIVYGSAPDAVFHSALDAGVNVVAFPTQTRVAHLERREI